MGCKRVTYCALIAYCLPDSSRHFPDMILSSEQSWEKDIITKSSLKLKKRRVGDVK